LGQSENQKNEIAQAMNQGKGCSFLRNLSQEHMPLPSEKCLLTKMNGPKALNPKAEYIQDQHYSRQLNDRMYDEQNMPPMMMKTA